MTVARQNALRASIVGLVLVLGSGVWLFWPQPPSPHREAVAQDAYLAVVIRTSALTGPPGSMILPGLGSAVPRIPGWLAFLLPRTFFVFLHSRDAAVGEGWTLVTDLGWRSNLYAMGAGLLHERLGADLVLIQDHGTLFVTRNRLLVQDLMLRPPGRDPGTRARARPWGMAFTLPPDAPDTLIAVDLSQAHRELTPWVERLQARTQFAIFPSIGEVEFLHAVVQWKEGSPMHGELTILTRTAQAATMVQADVEYLLDLLDRVMSTADVGMDKEIRTTPGQVELAVTLHHPERLARIPWGRLGEGGR